MKKKVFLVFFKKKKRKRSKTLKARPETTISFLFYKKD